jgi:predicted RNase H-like HicB family nuclease
MSITNSYPSYTFASQEGTKDDGKNRFRDVFHVTLKEEDDWVIAQCVELPAAVTQARSKEDALTRIIEAISLVLEETGGNPDFAIITTRM